MTIDEFTKVTTEIENFYQKEISDEQKKIWFSELKGMDIKRFKYVLSQVYRTCKFLHKLADIIEINTNLGYSQVRKEDNTKKCSKCKNTGYITYWKKIKNGDKEIKCQFTAVCSCGKQKQYKGWECSEERYRTNFYTPLAVELGL